MANKLLISIFAVTIIIISNSQLVYADGGVGSGGSGGGGGGSGWGWTTYGHGWALYGTSGNGPSDGFHSGNWSTIKNICQNANASQVAIYIMGTGTNPLTGPAVPSGKYMGYDDKGYSGAWGTGGSKDGGRATSSLSRSTAKNYFDQLPSYGVSTSGYTWGDNVGWFCWNFKTYDYTISGTTNIPTTPPNPQYDASGYLYVNPGQTVMFKHDVRNNGPTDMRPTDNLVTTIIQNRAYNSGSVGAVGHGSLADKASITSRNHTITVPSDAAAGLYCESIRFTPRTENGGFGTSTQKCINITIPTAGTYAPTIGGSIEHERGSNSDAAIAHGLDANPAPCNRALPVNTEVQSVTWQVLVDGAVTQSGTAKALNCPTGSEFSGALPSATSISAASLNSRPTVGSIIVKTGLTSPTNSEVVATVTLYEVPFTRFFGNDISICGTGDNNRFVFDDANGAGNYWRGSFVEYMSIYQSGNQAPNTSPAFSGMNTAVFNGFPAALDTNFAGNTPGGVCRGGIDAATDFVGATITNLPNNSVISGNQTGKRTYFVDGDVTINGNITTSGNKSITPFNPAQYPVTLIYATGNINITGNVSFIEAVLVAPNGSINTCSTASSRADYDNVCRNALKISGAVSANRINYQRAIGTRFLADSSATTTTNAGNGTASEIIEYPWYLSFVNFNLADTSQSKFNAYYALPPRL